ncbi:MAG: alpha-amylase [Planctomycetes bacterium]|nr:alpha-amylase [Planctomycetota bacterium]NOG53787.1 alpha-amylase [Planctomycetota bacterium]
MASVCFYFQVHQPYRLRRYSVFDTGHDYFDDQKNAEICRKVADKCYRPTTRLILDLVKRHEGRFKVAYSVTGIMIEQLKHWAPDVLDMFIELAHTGCCEFLSETYYHSLSFLYSRDEFREQIDLHTKLMQDLFGIVPTTFRNTELVYNNDLAYFIASMDRFNAVICEGVDRILGYRSPNFLYRPPNTDRVALMLKNYQLSDDVAFRFSNRAWKEWPLTAEKFAGWVNQINGNGYVCNLFMDYETFGEHQWSDTGIFQFLEQLPEKVFDYNPGQNDFVTPSEAAGRFEPAGEYDVPYMVSWADTERDLSAWLGNAMQSNALHEMYKLERRVKETRDPELIGDWRKLTTSDHFYYMCTKYFADGDVHKYFNPYESPYDSYINFMNVLDSIRSRAMA